MFIPLSLKETKQFTQSTPTLLIPFREQIEQKRGEQLQKFCNHMKRWHSDWTIIIIEQSQDNKKFNNIKFVDVIKKIEENPNVTIVFKKVKISKSILLFSF